MVMSVALLTQRVGIVVHLTLPGVEETLKHMQAWGVFAEQIIAIIMILGALVEITMALAWKIHMKRVFGGFQKGVFVRGVNLNNWGGARTGCNN